VTNVAENFSRLNPVVVKGLIDQFQANESLLLILKVPNDIIKLREQIHGLLIRCLIMCFSNVRSRNEKMVKLSLAKYIKILMSDFQIEAGQFAEELNENGQLQTVFLQICEINGIRISIKDVKKTPETDNNFLEMSKIEDYKDANGNLSLDTLCNYILGTKFPKANENIKLYEQYDKLPESQREQFFKEYLEFNKIKQINVETHCLDLVQSLDSMSIEFKNVPKHTRLMLNFNKFKAHQNKMLYSWYTENLNALNMMIKRAEQIPFDELNEDEKVIARFILHVKLIPRNVLINLITSTLISSTTEVGYVKVPELVRNLSSTFRRILFKEPTFAPIKRQLLQFFKPEDEGSVLFATVIKVFINNCKLDLETKDITTLAELTELDNKSIPKPFLTPDSKSKFPAFVHSLVISNGHSVGTIQIHPHLLYLFQTCENLAINKSLYLPMLCPPKKWTSPTEGGYLSDLKPLVNTTDFNTCMTYLTVASETGQLKSTYLGLDELGKVPWAINSKIFSVFEEVMEFENGFLTIPSKLINIPNATKEEQELRCKRIEYDLIRRVAKCFNENGDLLYLPHNVDFRGRAYPMVSVLSHYQEDLVRAMMMFWHSKRLGPDGFNWLKYQLAGVYGRDKLQMKDRLDFVDENMENIIDSALRPLDGNLWWKSAEKPWQTLALSMEIVSILNYQKQGGDISNYCCRIPVHQDGSCNGLQHYAALGADFEGGKSVNLVALDNGNTRGDVYSTVLNVVKSKVQADCNDEANSNHDIAVLANSLLSRKLIKQTVMTTVYGVTQYGGTLQINQRIKDILLTHKTSTKFISTNQFEDINTRQREISVYLSRLVLNSISELFSNAKLIQDWLVENAYRVLCSFDLPTVKYVERNVNKSRGYNFIKPSLFKPLMWTSLSGFPVIQLYRNTTPTNVVTTLQTISLRKPNALSSINKRKQLNAIAPNFVHSIDAIHMFMTCVAANQQGIQFVSVHDSFWTYPSDTTKLSKILRDEFIRLHSSNIISHLRDDLLYTVRNSYQLVWIKNDENDELIVELKKMRDHYGEVHYSDNDSKQKYSIRSKTQYYNTILWHELQKLTEEKSRTGTPIELIDKYKPKLYFKSKSSQRVHEYTTEGYGDKEINFLIKKFTPVLVPVKILPCPPTGTLDINEVRNSTFFFS
jgi:DNA-directed RNA polymerase